MLLSPVLGGIDYIWRPLLQGKVAHGLKTCLPLRRSPSSSPEESDEEEDDDEEVEEFEDDDSYEARPRAPKRPRRAPPHPAQRAASQHSPAGGELGGGCSGVNWSPHADGQHPNFSAARSPLFRAAQQAHHSRMQYA